MAPELRIEHLETKQLGGGAWRVDVAIENRGYLPTYVLSSAKNIALDARVFAEAEAKGCKLASDAASKPVTSMGGAEVCMMQALRSSTLEAADRSRAPS